MLGWALRDALLAFEDQLRDQARKDYQHAVLVWSVTAPHLKKAGKPPELPKILQG